MAPDWQCCFNVAECGPPIQQVPMRHSKMPTAPLTQRSGPRSMVGPQDNEVDQDLAKAPVFIVGMNGSGTTMLLDCLNNHPEFYGFPLETRLIPYYLKRAEGRNLNDDAAFLRLWNDLRNIVFFKIVNGGSAPPLPRDWAMRKRSTDTVLDAIFLHFAEREGKHRWCEKTPLYAVHMERLARAHRHARFIHLIRDGRDCAASFHRRWGYTPARTMLQWKRVVRQGRDQGQAIGDRYLEIRYEELTDWPRITMRKLCTFLGAPYTSDILELGRERNEQKTLSAGIVRNKEKWQNYFSQREVSRLESIGGRLLDELGYESGNKTGDSNPAGLASRYWWMKDNARRGLLALAHLVATRDWRRRRLILERIATSMRHKLNGHEG